MKQSLKLNDFEVWVHLGCLVEEQKHAQPVHFTLEISYITNLSGSHSDQLEDATDYVELTSLIKKIAQKKNYKLIEHLNHEVFVELVAKLKKHNIFADIKLTIRKTRAPIENLRNGVEFSCQLTLS